MTDELFALKEKKKLFTSKVGYNKSVVELRGFSTIIIDERKITVNGFISQSQF